jgi:DNA-binding transcriptional MerR regulator
VLGHFTLAQLARAVGMRVETLKFYHGYGLLPPARRRPGRQDDVAFCSAHVERLRFVRQALAHGFSLDMIAWVVDDNALVTCNDVYRLADARLERLRQDLGSEHPTVRALGELVASGPRKALEKTATYLRRSKTRQGRIPDAAPFTARPRPACASFDPAATA